MTPRTLIFSPGQIVATPGAIEAFANAEPNEGLVMLSRHLNGDWGDITDLEKELNDEGVMGAGDIHSAYQLSTGVRLWIITEADRSATTLLLPEEG